MLNNMSFINTANSKKDCPIEIKNSNYNMQEKVCHTTHEWTINFQFVIQYTMYTYEEVCSVKWNIFKRYV